MSSKEHHDDMAPITMTELMSFGDAIDFLKRGTGRKVRRVGWNGKNMWIALQRPDESSKMTLPYLYMFTAQGELVPWLASQTDILSEDWEGIL